MKHLIIGLLCLMVVTTHLAANPDTDFSSIDKLAQNTPSFAGKSIDALVAFGKKNTRNDAETVRFFFVWLAQNIHYDSLELASKQRRTSKQEPDSVFSSRKGICGGYADLLSLLCQKSNIPARTVTGYSKSADGASDTDGFHAWNVLKTDNQWALFDVTWASNHFEKTHILDDDFNQFFKQTPK